MSRKTSMESVTSNDSMMSDMSTTSDVSDVVKTSSSSQNVMTSRPADPKSVTVADPVNNNNSLPHKISQDELDLLKKLEEANRSEFFETILRRSDIICPFKVHFLVNLGQNGAKYSRLLSHTKAGISKTKHKCNMPNPVIVCPPAPPMAKKLWVKFRPLTITSMLNLTSWDDC